jgi:hypothetical protein
MQAWHGWLSRIPGDSEPASLPEAANPWDLRSLINVAGVFHIGCVLSGLFAKIDSAKRE